MSAKYWVGACKDVLFHSFRSLAISNGGISCVVLYRFLAKRYSGIWVTNSTMTDPLKELFEAEILVDRLM